jgi:hypothetical protein
MRLKEVRFWKEYDTILKGFIDFYRTFFGQVSTRNAPLPRDIYFPELVEDKLQFNNDLLKTAKMVRDRCIKDAKYANSIRWQPAFKQLIYRNDAGKLIVTISQNSIGNAITELLGVVVKRTPDADAYGGGAGADRKAAGSAQASGRGRSGQRHRDAALGICVTEENAGRPVEEAGFARICSGPVFELRWN